MTREPPSLLRPPDDLGPAWPAWLAGDRDALAALAARASDATLTRAARTAAAAAALLAEHQVAERFVLRSGLATQLAGLLQPQPEP
ncbi:MAG TPA: hypothetical protein PL196_02945, partial [Burkholderiaceae bacterium]|nr:hypothetical protein [Burkholderiaceae bacterium]